MNSKKQFPKGWLIPLHLEVNPVNSDERWTAFLHLKGTEEPTFSLACPGISKGVELSFSCLMRAVTGGRAVAFFGPLGGGAKERCCSAEDALLLIRAAVHAMPASAGEFTTKWVPCDPTLPF